jgi:iron-sulfur cluster assembly accessory protein
MDNLLNLTETAASELKRIAASENKPCRVRIAVRGGGCSGYQVHMDLTTLAPDPEMDLEYKDKEVHFIVDYKSATFFDGATLDFGGTSLTKTFQWNFPRQIGPGCGCGQSFTF